MPQNITDVDEFTEPVQAPVDTEPANVASIITTAIQPLANRTRYLKDHVDAAESDVEELQAGLAAIAPAVITQLTPTAAELADNGTLSLSLSLGYPSGAWGLSSNELQVPNAGLYRVALHLNAYPASAVATLAIECRVGASGVVRTFRAAQPGGTGTDVITIAGETIFAISTPATQKIWLRNVTAVAISTPAWGSDALYSMIVERIGDA